MGDPRVMIVVQRSAFPPSCELVVFPISVVGTPSQILVYAAAVVPERDRVGLPSRGRGRTPTVKEVLDTADFWAQALGVPILDAS